jgi:hypothetical protein
MIGAAIILHRRYFLAAFAAFVEQRLSRIVASMIELAVGLFLVVRNTWSSLPAAVIALMGWMAVVEATVYLLLPDTVLARLMRPSTRRADTSSGVLAIGAGFAFAWW